MKRLTSLLVASLATPLLCLAGPEITCGNLVYGKNQTSVCFAETFLTDVAKETNLRIAKKFNRVKLATDEVFSTPLCIFTGEGNFSLNEAERTNLKKYLMNGGFMIVSPGCSDSAWNSAFRRELAAVLPGHPIETLSMDHELLSTVHKITKLDRSSSAKLHGITINGRLAVLYSPEGLNNASNAKGCCCCGGSELSAARQINVNAVVYALLH